MKIQKKALAAIAEITNELGDQFDELRAEIDGRFGERRSEGEVFRPLPAPQGYVCAHGVERTPLAA